MTYKQGEFPKGCRACRRAFLSDDDWKRLPLFRVENGVELRSCWCGYVMAVKVEEAKP